jgi:hypothetical protein
MGVIRYNEQKHKIDTKVVKKNIAILYNSL